MADAYFDFHWPLSIIDLIKRLLGISTDPNNPSVPVDAANREWYSLPRTSTDNTTEVITTRFKLPLSISEIGFEALRVPSHWEVWYLDRSNNWLQVRDLARFPITLEVSGSQVSSWYVFKSQVYPIVAKAVQFRMRRNPDPDYRDTPYVIGMRNGLMRRNVYDRSQGVQYLEDEQDPLGNVISKYIRDWDAPKAIDDNPTTFWKSAPQPDPSAVCPLYLDLRNNDNTPRIIDKLYIDPVYTGQHLNLYYSNDDTVGIRKPSPITVPPIADENTDWRIGRGRLDNASGAGISFYQFRATFGPMVEQDAWIGVEWTPSFSAVSGPSANPVLLGVVPNTDVTGLFTPTLSYDVGAGQLQLRFYDGTDEHEYVLPLSPLFVASQTLRIAVGWAYNPNKVFLKVTDPSGAVLGTLEQATATLPSQVSFDGIVEMRNFRGLMTNTIIKLENYSKSAPFLLNPVSYVSPEPVIPDQDGNYPATTLDNSVYAASWLYQEHGTGGLSDSSFSDKEWTPIWKDYVSEKGMLFFPQAIPLKYLKLEFTNLTEEPYPIYDTDIEVKYKVFPISVLQQSSQGPRLYTGEGGFLGLGSFISINGVKSVNWLNPGSILDAVNAVFGKTVDPVQITTGPGYVSDTVPNISDSDIQDTYRLEMGSSYVYRRDLLDPYILSQNATETIIKAEGIQKLQPVTDIPWDAIDKANPGAIQKKSSPGALPIRGSDWWIFPGQTLRIPAAVMEKLTSTSTVVERKLTLEQRVRFTMTAVHRYEIKTLKRDAAIAYFAGLREVLPFTSTFIANEDREQYDFSLYDQNQWVMNGIKQLPEGPCTVLTEGDPSTLYKGFTTTSSFGRVRLQFRDSGLVRSNAMWADDDPQDNDNIEDTILAPYVKTIPETIPAGMWGDFRADWADEEVNWGTPIAVVSITVDGNRRYQGKRVLHFRKEVGTGECGIQIKQWTNFVPGAFTRLGAVFYKPFKNNNQLVIRLRRMSDGVFLYEETFDPPVGRWFEYQTKFFEVPDTDPVEGGTDGYQLYLTLEGDQDDELYLSDLYTEVSHVRYFARLGGSSAPLIEVTDLRYLDTAYATSTVPVTEFSVQAAILSPKAFCYGATFTPTYLR